jgi:membrane protease YdiL (CAAX protease family)
LLGIKATDNWRTVGLTFLVVISFATALFLYFNYATQLDTTPIFSWMTALAVAIPLSAINAFNEEIITRWSIAEGLGERYVRAAPWVSAIVFGSVHYFGVPGGLLGSIMAGFLGWFLTKSIQNTRGIGWAWVIHFVQDVLIFTVTIASLG